MKTRTGPAVLALISITLLASVGRAVDHTVNMTSDWTFSPNHLEIQSGDTVTWYNADNLFFHDATSTTRLWTTGVLDTEESATLAFDTPGIYPYHDSLTPGMTGTITVNAAPAPPTAARLILPAMLPDGAFRFTLTNLAIGKLTVIETTTNLQQWTPVFTNVPAINTLGYTNPPVPGCSFFRFWQDP
jgi:plastocyanin